VDRARPNAFLFVALVLATSLLGGCRRRQDDNTAGRVTYSPSGTQTVFSVPSGKSCFLLRVDTSTGKTTRVTNRKKGCEFDPSFSRDGKKIAYALADVHGAAGWLRVVDADGTNDHPLIANGDNEDDDHPVWALGDQKIFFLRSRFFGHYSPLVGPRRHDLDIFSVSLDGKQVSEVTEQHLYEITSLSISPDGEHLLVSTSRYPIGDLIEEYEVKKPQAPHSVYQPHVPREPSGPDAGPVFGDAVYSDDLTILFLAASSTSPDADFDYNVYSMDSVTGGSVQQITFGKGMAYNLESSPDRKSAIFARNDDIYWVDLQTHAVKKLVPPSM
jgi:Tol biopolymer transport system component